MLACYATILWCMHCLTRFLSGHPNSVSLSVRAVAVRFVSRHIAVRRLRFVAAVCMLDSPAVLCAARARCRSATICCALVVIVAVLIVVCFVYVLIGFELIRYEFMLCCAVLMRRCLRYYMLML